MKKKLKKRKKTIEKKIRKKSKKLEYIGKIYFQNK